MPALRCPAAVPRIPWTEALARDRNDDIDGAPRRATTHSARHRRDQGALAGRGHRLRRARPDRRASRRCGSAPRGRRVARRARPAPADRSAVHPWTNACRRPARRAPSTGRRMPSTNSPRAARRMAPLTAPIASPTAPRSARCRAGPMRRTPSPGSPTPDYAGRAAYYPCAGTAARRPAGQAAIAALARRGAAASRLIPTRLRPRSTSSPTWPSTPARSIPRGSITAGSPTLSDQSAAAARDPARGAHRDAARQADTAAAANCRARSTRSTSPAKSTRRTTGSRGRSSQLGDTVTRPGRAGETLLALGARELLRRPRRSPPRHVPWDTLTTPAADRPDSLNGVFARAARLDELGLDAEAGFERDRLAADAPTGPAPSRVARSLSWPRASLSRATHSASRGSTAGAPRTRALAAALSAAVRRDRSQRPPAGTCRSAAGRVGDPAGIGVRSARDVAHRRPRPDAGAALDRARTSPRCSACRTSIRRCSGSQPVNLRARHPPLCRRRWRAIPSWSAASRLTTPACHGWTAGACRRSAATRTVRRPRPRSARRRGALCRAHPVRRDPRLRPRYCGTRRSTR